VTRLNLVLLAALIACALGVITSQHHARKRFIELETGQATTRKLDEEWTQLQLEQSTWATHKRVESVASRQLGMKLPDPASTVVLTVEAKRP
jgi:cell division protein FtsL